MPYVVRKKTLKLVFADDHQLAGLVVRTRSLDSEAALDLAVEASALTDMDTTKLSPRDMRELLRTIDPLVEAFLDSVIDWDLTEEAEEGQAPVPVPVTLEGLKKLPLVHRFLLVSEWFNQAVAVSADLGKDSSSGVTFPEPSLPMTPQSPSLSSLTAPS